MSNFKERWLERLSLYKEEFNKQGMHEEVNVDAEINAFNDNLEKATKLVFSQGYAAANQNLDQEMAWKDTLTNLGNNSNHREAKRRHNDRIRLLAKLRDAMHQEDWADLREKVRFLIFRMITTIGIAVVVLGTAYVAHEMGINLPGLRISG